MKASLASTAQEQWHTRLCHGAAALSLIAALLAVPVARAVEPPVRVVKQEPQHCGVACAETVLRAYGDDEPWVGQTSLAAALCARLPEFKHRQPAASDAIEAYYPTFKETYQPELAELLIDHGYCVVSTRKTVDDETKRPAGHLAELLWEHLSKGHLAVLHVPEHYLAAVGVEAEPKRVWIADGHRSEQLFEVDWAVFTSGASFHTYRDGRPRPGWDGRALVFWKGEPINQKDRCPVCGEMSAGKTFSYCRKCRCWVERRASDAVQRALDTIAGCVRGEGITEVNRLRLGREVERLLESDDFTEGDLKEALCHYPLAGDDPARLETLQRHAAANGVDLSGLSLDDLIVIVTARERWTEKLDNRLVRAAGGS